MIIQAMAKINLVLEVMRKRSDGYHDLDTVFQSISLCDDLFIDMTDDGIFHLSVSEPGIPAGPENLVWRAWEALKRRFPGRVGGARVHLVKRIPHGAGLGGGSADAAAALRGLHALYLSDLSPDLLHEPALEIGMDVPFCLRGGTALAAGRGEILTPLERRAEFQVLVVHPGFPISTREAYASLDMSAGERAQRSGPVVQALVSEKVDDLWPLLYNGFEGILQERYPAVKEIRSRLLEGGCRAAVMTGSGSAVCGFASADQDLRDLASSLKRTYPFAAITRPVHSGVVIQQSAEYSA
ncbi:MAG TPA: 4-(cytidine 5'-diphospho)-2-C-methyl-D-erythritol kinase [Candidatus Sumerlaeota bacterium]|nr:4-(cytidine 5'-diphospho)-2-C-methyl-D-erythritol kinase [Candidatus Sumerlaeota bacterium]